MASRLKLQTKLEELLENRNVYYQPPSSIKMSYPAIRYSKTKHNKKYANNKIYLKTNCYEIIVIATRPDIPVIDKLSELPMCNWNRRYIADNLYHDVFELYY